MTTLSYFNDQPFHAALRSFYADLKIPVSAMDDKPVRPQDVLGEKYNPKTEAHALIDDVFTVGVVNDDAFKTEGTLLKPAKPDLKNLPPDYDGLLLFGVTLKRRKDGALPSRTILAGITRVFNQAFPTLPVTVVFRYGAAAGGAPYIALGNADRTAYKRQHLDGEKVGKVSLLKDIRTAEPHSGHLRILTDLAINTSKGAKPIHTFKALYEHWQSVFSIQTLNKRFYNELFHWYLWAKQYIAIPSIPKGETQSEDTLTSIFTIRLLTRLLFIWFVKEKGLIRKETFDEEHIASMLRKFDPAGEEDVRQGAREGSYYKAILQNLFFATLNTPMDKDAENKRERRQFIDPADKAYSDEYLDQTKYRYANLLKDEEALKTLFKDVPFLNGGLFECLDSKREDGAEWRYDGFSGNAKKQPTVPDFLFFSPGKDADVTKDFEEDKGKKKRIVPVRGLIHILSSYVFTIAENTPLEEEIALDPELLGKVFENLLASYNPETKTTARKQTGSFYTPREIVGYMVDESLKAYLLQKLCDRTGAYLPAGQAQTDMFGNSTRTGQLKIEESLRQEPTETDKKTWEKNLATLFGDAWTENPFSAAECNLLITALSNCRILDPACGSGAFPMGILQRTTALLARLDPANRAWKEAQLLKAKADKKTAESLQDATLREKALTAADERIAYIEKSFDVARDEFDFTRKLFLIENCIYGVDIQQIAVQIAKLRFFISLMAEQTVDDAKPNRNILSLPNLETKFVAGNTLIGLSRRDGMIIHPDVLKVEEVLRTVRRQIFYTRRYRDKKALRKEEAVQRERLKTALLKSGFGESDAEMATRWDPFDQMHAAPFYDSEMMFGFGKGEGFDVVIGNPPYGAKQSSEMKAILKGLFQASADSYTMFIEKGLALAVARGSVSYIIPTMWQTGEAYLSTRKLLSQNAELAYGIILPYNVFSAAFIDTGIYEFKKRRTSDYISKVFEFSPKDTLEDDFRGQIKSAAFHSSSWVNSPDLKIVFNQQARNFSSKFELLEISVGQITQSARGILADEVDVSNVRQLGAKRLLSGKSNRYHFDPEYSWVRYGDNLKEKPVSYSFFQDERILVRRIINRQFRIMATIAQDEFVCKKDFYLFKLTDKRFSSQFLLAIINSKLISFLKTKGSNAAKKDDFTQLTLRDIRDIKVPLVSPKSQAPFITLVDRILAKKKSDEDTMREEAEIDRLVYALYGLTEEEIAVVEGRGA